MYYDFVYVNTTEVTATKVRPMTVEKPDSKTTDWDIRNLCIKVW